MLDETATRFDRDERHDAHDAAGHFLARHSRRSIGVHRYLARVFLMCRQVGTVPQCTRRSLKLPGNGRHTATIVGGPGGRCTCSRASIRMSSWVESPSACPERRTTRERCLPPSGRHRSWQPVPAVHHPRLRLSSVSSWRPLQRKRGRRESFYRRSGLGASGPMRSVVALRLFRLSARS